MVKRKTNRTLQNREIRISNYTLSDKLTSNIATTGNHSVIKKIIQKAIDEVCTKKEITESALSEKIVTLLKLSYQLVPQRRGRVMIKVPEKITDAKSVKNTFKMVSKVIKFKVNPVTQKFVSTKRQNESLLSKTKSELLSIWSGQGRALERIQSIKSIVNVNMAFVKKI